MFTDRLGFSEDILKELLPCKIGDKVYTINKTIHTYNPKTYRYELGEYLRCQGFIIEAYDGNIRIRPAQDSWDGWYALHDDGLGYFTDKEEAINKVKELNELEEFKEQNRWIESL